MKKNLVKVLAGSLALASAFALVACSGGSETQKTTEPPKHMHVYGTTYSSDADNHWTTCECGDKNGVEAHKYDDQYDADCNVCGAVRKVKTKKEATIDYIKSLTSIKVEATNTFATSFDDMVKYLSDKKVITNTANPVDINKTAGYVKKYDGTFDDVMTIADKAFDYNGVYLLWWDIQNGSKNIETWTSIKNNGSCVIGGGMYNLPVTALSGQYAIIFKGAAEAEWNFVWDSTSELDYMTQKNNAIEAGKKPYADQIKTFTSIDASPSSINCCTTTDEIAVLLQKAGYITVEELGNAKSMNKDYSYTGKGRDWVGYDKSETGWSDYYDKTYYVPVASEANTYGKISVLYYDSAAMDGTPSIFKSIQDSKKADGTATLTVYAAVNNDGKYEAFKATDKKYDENGKVVTINVDLALGSFAFIVAD